MKRLFVAVPVSEEVRQNVKHVVDDLVKTGADLKLVSLEKVHFTLKFLGDVEESKISEIKEKLQKIAESSKKAEIIVKGVGVFPSLERINVVWIGVEDSSLISLMKAVNKELTYLKKNDHDEEIPHLTIDREKVQELVIKYKDKEFGRMKADKLILYESELTPEGPVYRIVAEFELK